MEEKTVERIARAFHDEYEAWAEANGWETQEATRTSFDDLPAENRETMLATVRSLLGRRVISTEYALRSQIERDLLSDETTLRAGDAISTLIADGPTPQEVARKCVVAALTTATHPRVEESDDRPCE